MPNTGQRAKVIMNGIYEKLEYAEQRQQDICGGSVVPTCLGNNSMYGVNGRITWIKTVKIGDLQNIDIYTPDPLHKANV